MSQFPPALEFTLNWEDPKRKYAVVPDVGGYAIAGVNSHAWPAQYAQIKSLSQDQRPPAVAHFYLAEFWNPMKVGGILNQDVANRVFDAGVNAGPGTAVKLLQKAINALGGDSVTVDGQIGPGTLAAANACDPEALLASYREQRKERYVEIVKVNPGLAGNMPEWLRRAQG